MRLLFRLLFQEPDFDSVFRFMITPTQQSLETLKNQAHPYCISCGCAHESGLALKFRLRTDNGVEADFECSQLYQGYSGFLHGGISSMLLDSAMANCLFAYQTTAVTARLIVRYQFPVKTDRRATVRAWMREYEPPLYVLEAEIEQDGEIVVRASGKFMNQDMDS